MLWGAPMTDEALDVIAERTPGRGRNSPARIGVLLRLVPAILFMAACGGADEGWPDPYEFAVLTTRLPPDPGEVPECGPVAPHVTLDSIGPWRAGMTRNELRAACGGARHAWDFGYEAIPSPVLVVRFGNALLFAELTDTSATGVASRLVTHDLRTPEGFGSGTPFRALREAWGEARLIEGECVLFAGFAARTGLFVRLEMPPDMLDCMDIPSVAATSDAERVPETTTVLYLIQTQR
jgi:hypothetical protein